MCSVWQRYDALATSRDTGSVSSAHVFTHLISAHPTRWLETVFEPISRCSVASPSLLAPPFPTLLRSQLTFLYFAVCWGLDPVVRIHRQVYLTQNRIAVLTNRKPLTTHILSLQFLHSRSCSLSYLIQYVPPPSRGLQILHMPPVYTVISFLSFRFFRRYIYLVLCYYCAVLYSLAKTGELVRFSSRKTSGVQNMLRPHHGSCGMEPFEFINLRVPSPEKTNNLLPWFITLPYSPFLTVTDVPSFAVGDMVFRKYALTQYVHLRRSSSPRCI
jgi:hypothetical protein